MRDVSIRIINLEHREDRRQESRKELNAIGLTPEDYQFFSGKYIADFGARGCALSHAQALSDFLFSEDKPFALILEDDFCIRDKASFRSDVLAVLRQYIHWDVFLLAHSDSIPIERLPIKNVYRVIHARTSSGYIVGRLYASKLINIFFRSAEMLARSVQLPSPNKEAARSAFSCDILWKELQTRDKFWATHPPLTFQRPSYSDIEKQHVTYRV
jgi:hypothetical protein